MGVEENYHVRVDGFSQSCGNGPLCPSLVGLRQDTSTRLWIERLEEQENNYDIEADDGQIGIRVEILLKMSHKNLTIIEEDIQ